MRLRWVALALVALGSFYGGGWLLRRGLVRHAAAGTPPGQATPVVGSRLFQDVLRHVRSYAVDSLEEATIYRLAASGMLSELDDPYAALVPSDEARSPGVRLVPRVGAYLDLVDGTIAVVAVRPGSPAAEAGIRSGDLILDVGGTSTDAMRPEEVARLLGGRSGSEVRLRLFREGTSPIRVTVTRGPVPEFPPLRIEELGNGIMHLRVFEVGRGAASAVAGLVADAVRTGRRSLVLDLRGVVDGELPDGVALASQFLPRNSLVAIVRGRRSADTAGVRTDRDGPFLEIPMVVLVDRGTSGAAEIVAGALQDHDRALVVGEPSFGRGATFSFFPLGEDTTLRLTTAHWLTPSGRVIQRGLLGSAEDTVPPPRPEFRTAAGRTVLGGGGIVPDRETAGEVGESSSTDAALALARELLGRARTTRMLLSLEGS